MFHPRERIQQRKSPWTQSTTLRNRNPLRRPERTAGRVFNRILLKTGCSREELNLSLPGALFTCKVPARSVAASLARLLLSQRCCIHRKGLPAVLTAGGLTQRKAYNRISGQSSFGPCCGTITLKQGRCKLAIAVLGYGSQMSKPSGKIITLYRLVWKYLGLHHKYLRRCRAAFFTLGRRRLSELQCIIRSALPSLASAPAVSAPSPLPTAA